MRRPFIRSDWALLCGTIAAVAIALILTLSNIDLAPAAAATEKATSPVIALWPGLLATGIAFACAAIAVGFDLQSSVARRLGPFANTFVMSAWQGAAAVIAWGAVVAGMLHVVLAHPEWASQTFNFQVSNNLVPTALVVGVSAIMIIRSKLLKVGDVEWGMEWVYLWTSAKVVDAVNRRKIDTKKDYERKFLPVIRDVGKHQRFYTDLEAEMLEVLKGKSLEVQDALKSQLTSVRTKYAVGADKDAMDDALNASIDARRYLVSTVIDYLGTDDLSVWLDRQT
jgi:hypothetical protein